MSKLFQAAFYKPEDDTWLAKIHTFNSIITRNRVYFEWMNLEIVEDEENKKITILLLNYPSYLTYKDYIKEAYYMLKYSNIQTENIWLTPVITACGKFSLSRKDINSAKILFHKAIPL